MRATSLIFAVAAMTFTAAAIARVADAPQAEPMQHGDMKKMTPEQMAEMHKMHHPMEHGPVVEARQAGFHLTLAAFLGIKAGIARGDDVKTLALPAAAISGWGKAIPAMFPPGTDLPQSDAMPNVWTDKDGFAAAAMTMSSAARTLADLGKAGDTAGFATQFGVLAKSCGDCHTKYRKPEPKK